MNDTDRYELGWCAFWGAVAVVACLLAFGCTPSASAPAGVTVEKGATVGTVEAKTETVSNHDMSETQRKAANDSQLLWYAFAVGGFLLGLALPSLPDWRVNLALGAIGVGLIGLPFVRAW